MSNDTIIVQSFRGLYDEKSKAVTRHISKRRRCFKHSFINASLHWDSPHDEHADSYFSINIACPVSQKEKPPYITRWGVGYGGIRYCEKCLLIDCIHLWEEPIKTYRIEYHKFAGEELCVAKCRVCGRRITVGGCGYHEPSVEAHSLINEVSRELRGGDFPSYENSGFGSGFYCELPSTVSQMIATGRTDEARWLIRQSILCGIPDSVINRHL